MATKTVDLNNTEYLKLDTGSGTALDCQNTSYKEVRIVLAAAEPAITETAYYTLQQGQGISRDGKAGDMWGYSPVKATAAVTVGE